MYQPPFPHPLLHLPRPGSREIRVRPVPLLPHIRNEREENHGTQATK